MARLMTMDSCVSVTAAGMRARFISRLRIFAQDHFPRRNDCYSGISLTILIFRVDTDSDSPVGGLILYSDIFTNYCRKHSKSAVYLLSLKENVFDFGYCLRRWYLLPDNIFYLLLSSFKSSYILWLFILLEINIQTILSNFIPLNTVQRICTTFEKLPFEIQF